MTLAVQRLPPNIRSTSADRLALPDRGAVVGVLGAGAMGTGIAHVAAVAGHRVVVADTRDQAVVEARKTIDRQLARDAAKGRLGPRTPDDITSRIEFAGSGIGSTSLYEHFAKCDLVIEAVVEDLEVKRSAFAACSQIVDGSAVLATNTSSLPVTAIAAAVTNPERVIGIHFFNPASVMPLVEIVPGIATDPSITAAARDLVAAWGKTPVVAKDTPGFIVNRVARPFYGESLRILEEGIADVPTVDWAMRTVGGFRMGPFELIDLIGLDVNYAVTRSVFEAMYFDPRYRPSLVQRRLVEAGMLGRKTGRGFYDYAEGAVKPKPTEDEQRGADIFHRVLAMLVNEAVDAVFLNVASPADIEIAMTKGVNYPQGLLAWGQQVGYGEILDRLEGLQSEYGDDRYRPSPLLRRIVRGGMRAPW